MLSTKQIILNSVISEMKKGDITDISMSKIANISDIGKSTIYEYFTSKEDMMYSAIYQMIDDYVNRLLKTSVDKDFKACFYEHLDCIIEIALECSALERIFRKSAATQEQFNFKGIIKPYLAILKKRVDILASKGHNEGILTGEATGGKLMVLSLIQGTVTNYVSDITSKSKEEIINLLYESTLKIINN